MKKKNRISFLLILVSMLFSIGCSAYAEPNSSVAERPPSFAEQRYAELLAKSAPFFAEQKVKQIGTPITIIEHIRPLSYILQYPEIGLPSIDAKIKTIVTDIRTAFEWKFFPQASPLGEQAREQKTQATLYLGYEAYVTNETRLSLLFFETHETKDGVSPYIKIQAYHFDLQKDQEISAKELMWENFAENASIYATNYFASEEPYKQHLFDNYKTLLSTDSGRFERFALTEDGVLFHFDCYDIFPESMGIVSLTIPYPDMQIKKTTPPTEKTAKKMIALTFDDGPSPVFTPKILDTLEAYNAKATFFDLGHLVEKYPEVVKRADALGCEIATHSYNHDNFTQLSDKEILADLKKTEAIFKKVLGHPPTAFRPPYGACNDHIKTLIPMPIYLWNIDTLDWKTRNTDAIIAEVMQSKNLDGSVILLHGIYATTAEATAKLVPTLQSLGYELVTISELVELKYGEIPKIGKVYNYHYFNK